MIVLGTSNDDRGKQLEALASGLLLHLGYERIVPNEVRAGGHELDLTAAQRIPEPGGERFDNWIVECKAHNRPLAMADWLKFVGKVFVENQTQQGGVFGCLIALSGVNGNVSGNYQALRQRCNSVRLLVEDEVNEAAVEAYRLPSLEEVQRRIGRHIELPFFKIEYAYYANAFYIMAFPSDGVYGLFQTKGELLDEETAARLVAMIAEAAPEYEHTDVRQRAESHRLQGEAEREVIVRLMVDGGTSDRAALVTATERLTVADLNGALDVLLGRGYVCEDDGQLRMVEDGGTFASIYRHLFAGGFRTDVLGCRYYDWGVEHILMPYALEQYPGLQLTAEQVTKATHLCQLSPAALVYALSHDPMIARPLARMPGIQTWLGDRLLHQMYRHLYNDFSHNSSLSRYFLRTRRLREVELHEEYTFKQTDATDTVRLEERVIAVQMAPEAGGGYGPVLARPGAPQPNEMPDTQD